MIDSLSLGPNLEIQVLITLGPIVCYLLPSFDDMIDGPLFNDSWPDFILMVELIDRLARFWISWWLIDLSCLSLGVKFW